MFVVSIAEEYVFLATRGRAVVIMQRLANKDGHAYDDLEVQDRITKQTRHLWFNTDYDMGLYKASLPLKPDEDPDLKKAVQLFLRGEALNALPLFESLSEKNPDDAFIQGLLSKCLWLKSGTNISPEDSLSLMQRAGKAAKHARQLGAGTPATRASRSDRAGRRVSRPRRGVDARGPVAKPRCDPPGRCTNRRR